MKSAFNNEHRPVLNRLVSILGLVLVCSIVAACASLPSSYRKTDKKLSGEVTTASRYQKKIGVAPVPNFTFIKDQDLESIIQDALIDSIQSQCKNALVVTPQDPQASEFLHKLPTLENGVVDNISLADMARAEGYNAIVTGALATITPRKERKGLWGWRKDHFYLKTLFFIDVYDPYDAAKSYSEPIFNEFKINANEFKQLEEGRPIKLALLPKTLTQMAESAGDGVCSAVGSRIWKGYVVEADEKQVTLSCGESRGIRVGDQFEVYDSARTMESRGGEQYYVPGYKIGEIEINRVRKEAADAKVITSTPVPVGSVVIPKY